MATAPTREKGPDEKFCSSCGEIIRAEAEICPECGVRQADTLDKGHKSPAIAALASFIFVGAGQVYNGQIAKGIVFHVGMWFAILFAVFFFWLVLPLFFPLAVWGYNIYDAHSQAQKLNRGEVTV